MTVGPPPTGEGPTPGGWLEDLSESDLAERLRQALRDTDQAVPTTAGPTFRDSSRRCWHAAQGLGLDWRSSDGKFSDPHWPDNPARASAVRVARMLATVPSSSTLLRDWVRRFVFSIVLGDNDANAKNIALLHIEYDEWVGR